MRKRGEEEKLKAGNFAQVIFSPIFSIAIVKSSVEFKLQYGAKVRLGE